MALLRRLGSCDWFIEGNVNKTFATEMTGMTCGFASKEGNTRQRPAPARRRGRVGVKPVTWNYYTWKFQHLPSLTLQDNLRGTLRSHDGIAMSNESFSTERLGSNIGTVGIRVDRKSSSHTI